MQFGDEHKAWQKNRSLELKSKTSILRTYSYDPVGNRLTFNEDGEIDTSTLATDSNQLLAVSGVNAESRLYDIQGNSLQLSTPLFDDLQLTYNQSGRLKTLSNSGTVSDYLYDGNSLRVVKDNDGVITHYHYDLQGRLLAETDSDGTLQRAVVWYGDTPAALIDIEQSEPTFYTCTTTESFTDAVGPGMTIDTAAHSIVIQDGDYAGTYAISDEDWQVYPTAIVFSWRGGGVEFQGGLYPDYELPRRSGGLIFYEDDDEGNSQIADIYKVWKQSEGGSSTIATRYQVHTDQIGAPVLLTDATGTAVWSAQYAPSVKPQSTAMSTATAPMSCATCASPASTLTRNPVCITIGIATMNHGLGGILPWIRLGWMEGMLICMLMWEMAHSTGLIHLA